MSCLKSNVVTTCCYAALWRLPSWRLLANVEVEVEGKMFIDFWSFWGAEIRRPADVGNIEWRLLDD